MQNSYITKKEVDGTATASFLKSMDQVKQAVKSGWKVYKVLSDESEVLVENPENITDLGPAMPAADAGGVDPDVLTALKIILEGGE